MRVLQIFPASIDFASVRLMASGFRDAGVEASFGSLYGTTVPSWTRELDIEVFDLGLSRRLNGAGAAARTAGLVRTVKPDVFHTHLIDANLAGAIASSFVSPPFIHTRHHLDEHWLIGKRYHVELDRFAGRASRRIVAPSQALHAFLAAREGVPRQKVDIVYPCFDFEALTPDAGAREAKRRELGVEDRFVVGCVSRFIPFKGHSYLLQAAQLLREAIPDLVLLFVGPGPTAAVNAEIEQRNLNGRVILTGPRSDVTELYAGMDATVQPSLSETASQVVVEGMISGTPGIATRVGGIPELVAGSGTILVPPANPRVLAGEIKRLYEDAGLREELSRTGKEAARRNFVTADAVASQLECYRRCLA